MISIVDYNLNQTGVVSLKHDAQYDIPLDRGTLAPALYVVSKVLDRPVAIDTIASAIWLVQPMIMRMAQQFGGVDKIPDEYFARAFGNMDFLWETLPIRVTVKPTGEAQIQLLITEADAISQDELGAWTEHLGEVQAFFGQAIQSYILDASMSYGPERIEGTQTIRREFNDKFRNLAAKAFKQNAYELGSTKLHIPTAPRAVMEFEHMVTQRIHQTLKLAVEGKWPIKVSNDGSHIKLKAVPAIPSFNLDPAVKAIRKLLIPKTPPEERWDVGSGQFVGGGDPNPLLPGVIVAQGNQPAQQPQDMSQYLSTLSADAQKAVLAALKGQENELDAEVRKGIDFTEVESKPLYAVLREKNKNRKADLDKLPDEDLEIKSGPYLPGDKWPDPEGKGQGEGEGDGEGEPGEPNEEPGEGGAGEGEVRIPIEDFGRLLMSELQLPNMRETVGEISQWDDIRIGSIQKPSGAEVPERIAENYIEKAIGILQAEGIDWKSWPIEDLIAYGAKHHDTDDVVVKDREPHPRPDTNAVIVIKRDGSGSMGPDKIEIIDRAVGHFEALAKASYDTVKIIYIIYDTEARVVEREEFFTLQLGGGTIAKSSLELEKKILDEDFPRAKWNRYGLMFSDGDDFQTPEAMAIAEPLTEELEYFLYSHVNPAGLGSSALSTSFQQLAAKNPKRVGFSVLTNGGADVLQMLKDNFSKKPK
jgi:uncharacterized sporulation protein YeaH/YhbH (DUF444 family)